ncbi:MAG: sigma 54-interacting transcriptional regulator [Planctomycetota bacterium]
MAEIGIVNGRYELQAVLAATAEGQTFRAHDRLEPRIPKAIKFLEEAATEIAARQRASLAFLAALRHPHLNPVTDLGKVLRLERTPSRSAELPDRIEPGPRRNQLFLVTPYLTGGDVGQLLAQRVALGGTGDELDRLLSGVTIQVLSVLQFLHDQDLVHFDVKPEHLLIDGEREYAPGVPHVRLIDLGLLAPESTPLGTRVRGTYPYIAPEVLDRSLVDNRADLYSLGALLYQSLTASSLLQSHSRDEIESQRLLGRPLPLTELVPRVPAFWAETIARLLAPEPERRPASAASLIRQIEERGSCPAPPTEWQLPPARFTGQERDLDSILRELEETQVGDAAHPLILLVGEPGVGKRAVCRRLMDLARLQGAIALRTTCRASDGPLDPIARWLRQIDQPRFLSADHRIEVERLIRWIGEGREPSADEQPALVESVEERQRLLGRLGDVFFRLAPEDTYLFVLDDLECAAPELIDLLGVIAHRLARSHLDDAVAPGLVRDPRPRVLLLGVVDEGAIGAAAPAPVVPGRIHTLTALEAEPSVARIGIKSLSLARSRELVRQLVGDQALPARVLAEFHQISGGHWLTLTQRLREARRLGLIRRQGGVWSWYGADSVSALLETRRRADWDRLDSWQRQALHVIALGLRYFEAPDVEEVLRRLGNPLPAATLHQLGDLGWIAAADDHADETRWELERPLPEPPGEAVRSSTLRALADVRLQRHPRNPVPSLLLQLEVGAVDAPRELVTTALQLLQGLHCHVSITRVVQRLREALPPEGLEPEWELSEAQAWRELQAPSEEVAILDRLLAVPLPATIRQEALLRRGRSRSEPDSSLARERLELALASARELGDAELTLQVHLALGQLALRSGAIAEASEREADAKALVHGSDPSVRDLRLLAAVAEYSVDLLTAQGFAERAEQVLRETLDPTRPQLPPAWRSRLLSRWARLAVDNSRYEQALSHALASLPIDRALGNRHHEALTLATLGRIHVNRGEPEQAAHHHLGSLRLRCEVRDLGGIAASKNNVGLVYKMQNRLDEAEACFRASEEIFRDLGVASAQAAVMNNLSDILLSKGKYDLALKYAKESLERRRSVQDAGGMAHSYYRIASIYKNQGQLDRAADYAEKSLAIRRDLSDKLNLAYSLELIGELHCRRARFADGFRCLRQSLSNFEALGDRLGRQVLLALLGDTFRQLGLLDEGRDSILKSLAIAREHGVDYYVAISLQSLGTLHRATGDLAAATACLSEAEGLFRQQRGRRDLAQVLLERTEVALLLGEADQVIALLAEAYEHVDELDLSDLYPTYYRLRGSVAASGKAADRGIARKLLERGLAEAQRLELPEEAWRLLRELAHLDLLEDQRESAQQHLARAVETIHAIHSVLPAPFRDPYIKAPERAAVLGEWQAARSEESQQPAADSPPATDPQSESGPATTSDHAAPAAGVLLRLQEVATLLNSERDLDVLLHRLIDELLAVFQAERGFLLLLEQGDFKVSVARNLDQEEIASPQFQYSHSIAEEVARTGRSFITDNAQRDERLRGAHSVHDLRLRAIACFPIEWRDQRLGVVYLENRFRKQLLGPGQLPILQAFSNQAAVAIANARLHEENERRQRELEASQTRIRELNAQLERRVAQQSKELEETRRRIEITRDQLEDRFQFHNLTGRAPQMLALYRTLERFAQTELPILIEGESGTGKELAASAIHFNSRRKRLPFVSENCGALAESIFESELFGHVRGAFTGADQDREGLIAIAERGTLFLDEVHELSLDMQKKLLRFLQEGVYRPVGGKEFRTANVRILSASNRPLLSLVKQGAFREDLYYRLNVLRVDLPPLRQRGQDIILLARTFLAKVVETERLEPKEFTPAALRKLSSYPYPGNVRELRNVIEKAAILCAGSSIEEADILFDGELASNATGRFPATSEPLPLRQAKEEFQRCYLERLLEQYDGVVARAARRSGITRESFHRLMKRYGIQRD